jgi:chemotaxis protein MotA
MRNLSDPSKIGSGIAVAFVATVYGVGLANLLYIPLGGRMKKIAAQEAEVRSMVLTGLSVIAAGAHPRQVEEILAAYLSPKERSSADAQEREAA